MKLKIFLTHRSEKDIKNLSEENCEKVKNALRFLSDEPFKGESLLGKYKGLKRYRIGDFRIVYEINLKEKCIVIIKIKHRKDVYR
ncbi:MAG: type II toxin-antitoxin system RelE/ParE family toxin [Elusimicrobiota bacterium]